MTDEKFIGETAEVSDVIDAAGSDATVTPAVDADAGAHAAETPHYGIGPFSIREVALGGVWLAAFVVSFFPFRPQLGGGGLGLPGFGASVWGAGIEFILAIALPTAAVFLIVLRRFSPDGIRRVGSLGVDQFASVAFSVAAMVWLTWLWSNVSFAIGTGSVWLYTWVVWVEFLLMLAGVVLTVFAPIIPPFSEDFRLRRETVAHRLARPARPVVARPAPEPKPVVEAAAAEPAEEAVEQQSDDSLGEPITVDDLPVGAVAGSSADTSPVEPVRHQAFWALAPEERDVVDEAGIPIFRIGPTAWALVIEDRGEVFVVRDDDGRVGFLHDVSNVTRG